MKSQLLNAVLAILLLGVCTSAIADDGVVELFKCRLNEGKTMEDVAAANGNWVKFMNANVEGGGIASYGLTAIVGDTETFLYADIYPSLESWTAGQAVAKTDAMKPISAGLDAVAKCEKNSLYSSTQH